MDIIDEEYEIVGYIKKICVCDKCMHVMDNVQFIPDTTNDIYQYKMKCPKCGREELVNTDLLKDQFKLIKKVEE